MKFLFLFLIIFIISGCCNQETNFLADNIVKKAKSFIDVPYKLGMENYKGIDCSGLVWHCFVKNGYKIERLTAKQYSELGKYVKLEDLQTGDLIFFKQGNNVDHVGIVTQTGCFLASIKFVHASKCYNKVVESFIYDHCDSGGFNWKDLAVFGRRFTK